MKTTNRNSRIIMVLFLLIIACLGVIIYVLYLIPNLPVKTNETPEQSNQEKNLEVLKSTQPRDLVLCFVEGTNTPDSEIKFAFLVEENMGTYMTGYYPSKYTLSRAEGGESFLLLSTWKCEMRIFRPGETRSASDMLTGIILYGPRRR